VDPLTGKAGVPVQLELAYDINRNLGFNATTGQRPDEQFETTLGLGFHAPLPEFIAPKKGDKTPPQFGNYEINDLGMGKVSVKWETDKITKGEAHLNNANGDLERAAEDKNGFAYYHELVIDNLKPDTNYQIQVLAKDANDNETLSPSKKFLTPP
jgi:hypothetical protein